MKGGAAGPSTSARRKLGKSRMRLPGPSAQTEDEYKEQESAQTSEAQYEDPVPEYEDPVPVQEEEEHYDVLKENLDDLYGTLYMDVSKSNNTISSGNTRKRTSLQKQTQSVQSQTSTTLFLENKVNLSKFINNRILNEEEFQKEISKALKVWGRKETRKTKGISLSFCDCKIILLYILAYNFLPDEKKRIIKLIKTVPIAGTKDDDGNLIGSERNTKVVLVTLYLIDKLFNVQFNFHKEYFITRPSCSSEKINTTILTQQNGYNILFKGNNLETIAKNINKIYTTGSVYIRTHPNNELLKYKEEELQKLFDTSESNA